MPRRVRFSSVAAFAVAATTVAIASVALAGITTYDVAQIPLPSGCVSTFDAACYQAPESGGAGDIALGPGGGQAYATAFGDDSVLSFNRDASTGALWEKSAADNGCINGTGNAGAGPGGCGEQATLDRPTGIVVPTDGQSVHTVSFNSDAINTFHRSAGNGALTIPTGTNDCLVPSSSVFASGCEAGHAIDGLTDVVTSPDGKNLYASSANDGAIAVITRNPLTGNISQAVGAAGCIANNSTVTSGGACTVGTVISPQSLAVSPDGSTVYAVGNVPDGFGGLWAYTRANDGTLSMASSTNCWQTAFPSGTCFVGYGLSGAAGVAVSPDGNNVYVASSVDDAVAVFSRDANGGVFQLGGLSGCVSDTGASGGTPGRCTDGRALNGAVGVTVTPDGKSVYVNTGQNESLAIFDRNLATGALSQRAGTAGCIANTPATDGCASGTALGGYNVRGNIAVAPDGRHVYAANGAITVFSRTTMQGLDVAVTGQGAVTSSPAGIDCGPTCAMTVQDGTNVTLTATPADGWELAEWTGACAGLAQGRSCALTMIAGLSTGAVFRQLPPPTAGASSGASTGKGADAPPSRSSTTLRAGWSTKRRTITARVTPVKGANRYVIAAVGKGRAKATGRCVPGRGSLKGLAICTVTVPGPGAYTVTVTGAGSTGLVASVSRKRKVQ